MASGSTTSAVKDCGLAGNPAGRQRLGGKYQHRNLSMSKVPKEILKSSTEIESPATFDARIENL
jgi:hypothetical protein